METKGKQNRPERFQICCSAQPNPTQNPQFGKEGKWKKFLLIFHSKFSEFSSFFCRLQKQYIIRRNQLHAHRNFHPRLTKILSNKLIHSHDCVTAINSMLLAREPFLCNFLSIHRLSFLELKLLPASESINQSACGMHRENNEMRN